MNREEELISMYGYIKGIVIGKYNIHHPDCEDVVGNVYLCCVRNLPKFRGDCALKTWVCGITMRRSIDHIRKLTSRRIGLNKLKAVLINSRILKEE